MLIKYGVCINIYIISSGYTKAYIYIYITKSIIELPLCFCTLHLLPAKSIWLYRVSFNWGTSHWFSRKGWHTRARQGRAEQGGEKKAKKARQKEKCWGGRGRGERKMGDRKWREGGLSHHPHLSPYPLRITIFFLFYTSFPLFLYIPGRGKREIVGKSTRIEKKRGERKREREREGRAGTLR